MPPKKAAKKREGPNDKREHHAKDLRRAYEHLGRVQTLQRLLKDSDEKVLLLVSLAQESSAEGRAKDVADLIRAAEHLAFAELADLKESAQLPGSVEDALRSEFDHLMEKAEKHWEAEDAHPTIASSYEDALRRARQAWKGGSYRRAMEMMRCAEALAHVHIERKRPEKKIGAPHTLRELAAS